MVEPLNTYGLVTMILSIGIVISLMTFCLVKVLNLPPVDGVEHLKGPLEIDTGDTQDAD